VQLYLALSGVLASGGSEVLSALAAAEAELAAIGPDAAKNKVLYLHTVNALRPLQGHAFPIEA
jgi:hypothetical protein